MAPKDQQRAHELAQLACRLAAGLQNEDIQSFTIEHSPELLETLVTLRLANGQSVTYAVTEEKVGDRPIGQSHPDSPSR